MKIATIKTASGEVQALSLKSGSYYLNDGKITKEQLVEYDQLGVLTWENSEIRDLSMSNEFSDFTATALSGSPSNQGKRNLKNAGPLGWTMARRNYKKPIFLGVLVLAIVSIAVILLGIVYHDTYVGTVESVEKSSVLCPTSLLTESPKTVITQRIAIICIETGESWTVFEHNGRAYRRGDTVRFRVVELTISDTDLLYDLAVESGIPTDSTWGRYAEIVRFFWQR